MSIRILVCILFFIKISNGCLEDPQSKSFFCTSWDELKNGNFPEFTQVHLHMVGTNHQTLDQEFFASKLNHLENISIKGGNITFQKGVFNGMKNLKNLDLFSIESKFVLKEGLFDNTGMKNIFLYNTITGIEPGSFENMPNARQAWISHNELSTIKKGTFTNTNFKMVFLVDNKIENIEEGAFAGMKNLGYLDLAKNMLKTIDMEKILGKSLSLEVFIIGQNELKVVPDKILDFAPNLEVFNCSYNGIKTIQDGVFQNGDKLWLIDISYNKIQNLQENILSKSNILRNFFFHGNNLQFISPKLLERLPKLKEISFADNDWICPCFAELNSWVEKRNVSNVCDVENLECNFESKGQCKYEVEEGRDVTKGKKGSNCHVEDWRLCAKRMEKDMAD